MRPRTIILSMILLRKIKNERLKKRRKDLAPVLHICTPLSEKKFYTLYNKLRNDPNEFRENFRMSQKSFHELSDSIKRHEQDVAKNNGREDNISVEQKLMITLRYLADGSSFEKISMDFNIEITTVTFIISNICQAIINVHFEKEIPLSSTEDWQRISEDFFRLTDFPHCIGAIVGKRIALNSVNINEDENVDHPVLLAIVDAHYFFTAIDFDVEGRSTFGTSLKCSQLGQKIENWKQMLIPKPKLLPNSTGENCITNYVFVGDESFCLMPNLMRPYPKRSTDEINAYKIYNYRLERARRYGDSALGILTNKWEVLDTVFFTPPDFVELVCRTACILHNFILRREGYEFTDSLTIFKTKCNPFKLRANSHAQVMRSRLCEYFNSPAGATDYQDKCLIRY